MESNASQSTKSLNSEAMTAVEEDINIDINIEEEVIDNCINESSNDSIVPSVEYDLIIDENENSFDSFFSTNDHFINKESVEESVEESIQQSISQDVGHQLKTNHSKLDLLKTESIVDINSNEEKKQKSKCVNKKIKRSVEKVTKSVKTNHNKSDPKLIRKKCLDKKFKGIKRSILEKKNRKKSKEMFGQFKDSIDSNDFEKLYSTQCQQWFKRKTRFTQTQDNSFFALI
jgi:hypothetical protein